MRIVPLAIALASVSFVAAPAFSADQAADAPKKTETVEKAPAKSTEATAPKMEMKKAEKPAKSEKKDK